MCRRNYNYIAIVTSNHEAAIPCIDKNNEDWPAWWTSFYSFGACIVTWSETLSPICHSVERQRSVRKKLKLLVHLHVEFRVTEQPTDICYDGFGHNKHISIHVGCQDNFYISVYQITRPSAFRQWNNESYKLVGFIHNFFPLYFICLKVTRSCTMCSFSLFLDQCLLSLDNFVYAALSSLIQNTTIFRTGSPSFPTGELICNFTLHVTVDQACLFKKLSACALLYANNGLKKM